MTAPVTAPSPKQARTRAGLVRAAAALAAEDASRSFTMRTVAERAGVSPATAYTYFSSREHVLAEAYADWVEALAGQSGIGRVGADDPDDSSALVRVRSVVDRAVAGVTASPDLAKAFTLALAADDPAVASIRPRIQRAFTASLSEALDPLLDVSRRAAVATFELVFFAAMISFAHGLRSIDELAETLDDAATLLFADER